MSFSGEPVINKFSTRDLRRTFKTLSGLCGLSKEIRDRLQDHAFQDVGSKNYDRYDYWLENKPPWFSGQPGWKVSFPANRPR